MLLSALLGLLKVIRVVRVVRVIRVIKVIRAIRVIRVIRVFTSVTHGPHRSRGKLCLRRASGSHVHYCRLVSLPRPRLEHPPAPRAGPRQGPAGARAPNNKPFTRGTRTIHCIV